MRAKAKQYGCYIQFGAYAVDKDWPGHVLSITSIIGPDGKLVARDWKARNIVGVFPDFELVTTTVYNVLDRYVEMYGTDAVVPVHQTDIGNLATSSTQLEPELFRVMALKGAEILLRTASGGYTPEDIQMVSAYNRVYSVIVNNAVSPDNPGFLDDSGGGAGGTAIYGPRGRRGGARPTRSSSRPSRRAFRWRHSGPGTGFPTCTCRCIWTLSAPTGRVSRRACSAPTSRRISRTPSAISTARTSGGEAPLGRQFFPHRLRFGPHAAPDEKRFGGLLDQHAPALVGFA